MISPGLIEKVEKIKMPYRLLILAGTLGLMVAAFVFLIYFPKTEQIEKNKKAIASLNQKIHLAKMRAKELPKLEAELAAVDTQFREALRLLPNEREIPTLLKSITQKGSDSNLVFRLFSPRPERPQDFYIEIPVSMEVSGRYHNVAKFFSKVGEMERIVNILNVNIKPEKELGTNLITKCTAVTYRFKGSPDEKKGPQKVKKRKG
jgi:type IV pilus assembly protein PilO